MRMKLSTSKRGRLMQRSVFNEFRRVVYGATGISLGPSKEALVTARVGKRLRALGLTNHKAYLKHLVADESGREMTQFVDAICTNVTSFFREEEHFEFVRAAVGEWRDEGQTRFRIWSAACSTGEEVYSLAMTLSDVLSAAEGHDLRILGTDLSTRALSVAVDGRYSAKRMERIHPALRERHFDCLGCGEEAAYAVKPTLRSVTVFRQANLSQTPLPLTGPLDIVLCRNVMIYFDKPVRAALVAEAVRLLRPGGYLIVGHSESLSDLRGGLVPVAASIYRKT